MTTFKTFLKVLKKCKVPIIMYTVILFIVVGSQLKNNDSNMSFTIDKPDILIINNDSKIGITENLINYIEENSNIKKIKNDKESINDALFYRDVNYIIYIPKDYRNNFLKGENPPIEVKATGDYQSSLASMLLNRYLNLASTYFNIYHNEDDVIAKLNETFSIKSTVSIASKLDTNALNNVTNYYNFLNYSMMAGAIYVICLVLISFNSEMVRKRTIVSSMNYRKQNRILLLSNFMFSIILWLFYIIMGFILCGDIIFSSHGILYILNSFIFTFCCVTIAFLISSIVNNKNAISGIINVVALGSSFLCGSFVPVIYLPDTVLKIAHVLPSYWYINSNELLKNMETINFISMKPVIVNMVVLFLFSILFIVINNLVTRRKRKIL